MKLKKLVNSRIVIVGLLILIQMSWFFVFIMNLSSQFWWIQIALQGMSIVAFLIVLNTEMNPAYKLAWVSLILLFPVLGGLMYVMYGNKNTSGKLRNKIERSQKGVLPFLKDSDQTIKQVKKISTRIHGQMKYIRRNTGFPVYGNTKVKYYPCGEENYPDMIQALKEAKEFIFLEYFIIAEGKMWSSILDVLKEKAANGVDVRVILDDFGCLSTLPYRYERELATCKIKCIRFNPMIPVFSMVMNHRDHRKILVIDGITGFTGGINLADEYINEISRFGYWKDTGIKVTGEGVWSLTCMFLSMWEAFYPEGEDIMKFHPSQKALSCEQDGFVQPYGDSPLDSETVGENVYLNMICQAQDYLYVYTPYLIIDNEMMQALCLAAKRGVDVRIMTPGIPDKKLVFALTKSYYPQLVKSGVKIYQYNPGFLHAKCMICDDEMAVIGTINMDYRSFYLHFECGVLLSLCSCIEDMKKDFLKTQEQCMAITQEHISHRLPFRLLQAVLRYFAPLM